MEARILTEPFWPVVFLLPMTYTNEYSWPDGSGQAQKQNERFYYKE